MTAPRDRAAASWALLAATAMMVVGLVDAGKELLFCAGQSAGSWIASIPAIPPFPHCRTPPLTPPGCVTGGPFQCYDVSSDDSFIVAGSEAVRC